MQEITKKILRQYIQNFFSPHVARGPAQYEVRSLQEIVEYALREAMPPEDIGEFESRMTTANFKMMDEIGFERFRYIGRPMDEKTFCDMNCDLLAKVKGYSLNYDLKTMFYNMVTKTEWKEDCANGIIFKIVLLEGKGAEGAKETT